MHTNLRQLHILIWLFTNGNKKIVLYRILKLNDSQIYKKANFTDCEILVGSWYFAIALFFEDTFTAFKERTITALGEIRLNQD